MRNKMEIPNIFKFLLALSVCYVIAGCTADATNNLETDATMPSLPTTQEMIRDCEAAVTFAENGDYAKYYRTNCFAFTFGLGFGQELTTMRIDPTIEDDLFCLTQEFKQGEKGIYLAGNLPLIKAIISLLKKEMKKNPGLADQPSQYLIIGFGIEEICTALKGK